jgi:hypothetical protein
MIITRSKQYDSSASEEETFDDVRLNIAQRTNAWERRLEDRLKKRQGRLTTQPVTQVQFQP